MTVFGSVVVWTMATWVSSTVTVTPHAGRVDLVDPVRLEAVRRADLVTQGQHVVTLLDRTTLSLARNGRVTLRRRQIREYLNDEGVREWAEHRFRVDGGREKAKLELAFTITPEGELVNVDRNTVQIQREPRSDVFTNDLVVRVQPAALSPGAIAVVEYSKVYQSRRWPFPFSMISYPQWLTPVERYEIEVAWEPGVPRPSVASDAERLTCKEDGARHFRCVATGLGALPWDHDIRSVYDLVPSVVVARKHSWADLAQDGGALVDDAARPTPALRQRAAALAGEASDARSIVEELYRFVANEIRYVAFEHGVGAVRSRAAHLTLARRYGDCKDKVALFLALARASGIDAYPVLVATHRFDPGKLVAPSWRHFDHMIACVDLEEEPLCLELTMPNAPAGVLGREARNAVALALKPGTTAPHQLARSGFGFDLEIEVRNVLRCDGTIEEQVRRQYNRQAAIPLRSFLAGMTFQERSRWAVENYQSLMGDSTEPTASFAGVDSPAAAVEVTTRNSFPGTAPAAELSFLSDATFWLAHYAGSSKSNNQHHDYDFGGMRIVSRAEFLLCDDVHVRFPGATLDLSADLGSLQRTYELAGDRAVVTTRLEMPQRRVAVEELKRFNRFLDMVGEQASIWLKLENGSQGDGQ